MQGQKLDSILVTLFQLWAFYDSNSSFFHKEWGYYLLGEPTLAVLNRLESYFYLMIKLFFSLDCILPSNTFFHDLNRLGIEYIF